MFPKDFLFQFREYKEGQENIEVDPELRKAWSSFISEFCRSVSYHWKSYLGKIRNRENATFKDNLSTSDEAFAMWVVFCKYDEAEGEAKEIKVHGIDRWKETRKKKRAGPHDSREHINDYIKFYLQVQKNRADVKSDKYWQDMFFDDLFGDPNRENNSSVQEHGNPNGGSEKGTTELCLPGIDDDFADEEVGEIRCV
jgi:hypothetical protein